MNAGTSTDACLLLIDGHAYAYRSFHAIRELTAPSGEPTNAIFGFVKAVQRLVADWQPSHAAAVWDGGLAAERLALLPEYKAQRPPTPPALAQQFSGMVAWLEASGFTSLQSDGIEADDWIATLARRAAAEGCRVVIASSDKDFMQLVSDRVTVANPGDKTGKPKSGCTAADVVAKFGVRPEQIVDYLSLVGDAVDNIPGVPGVGPKTAAALLARFGNWEGIAAALAGVEPERIRTALAGSAETVERNRKMICLKTGLDLRPEWSELHVRPAKPDRLRECYARWGFRSLLAGLGEPGQGVLL